MPKIAIPNRKKKFARADRGEVFGNVWASKNIDFDANEGRILLSESLQLLISDSDDGDFEQPLKFIRTDADTTDRWWALTVDRTTGNSAMFKTTNTDPTTGWTQDAIANTPSAMVDDMEIFGTANGKDRLIVAQTDDLALLNNGTWTLEWWDTTLAQSVLTAGQRHQLHSFLNFLAVADGRNIHTIDDSLVVSVNRIQLPVGYEAVWFADDGIFMYIGSENKKGKDSLVFPWDGTSATYEEPIPVESYISLAGVSTKQGVMHTISGRGELLKFNGRAFDVIAALPVASSRYSWDDSFTRPEMVHPNGIDIVDGKITMAVNAGINGTDARLLENMPSGIWVYDEEVGLTCKYSFISQANESGVSGLKAVGAIRAVGPDDGRFLAGAMVYTDNFTTLKRIMVNSAGKSTSSTTGYFITIPLEADAAQAFWQRIQLLTKDFETANDKIVVKYRITKKKVFEDSLDDRRFAITWTSTTTFTTTDSDFANVTAGDEVEIIAGIGAGRLFHVSSISLAGSTYTVTIDEVNTGATTQTGQVRIQNWTKLMTMSGLGVTKKLMSIGKLNKWIQFKIELRGGETSPEIYEFLVEFTNREK